MAAANTDKLKKVARKWVGQVGSGGISDAVVTSFNITTTNLPTDTAVVITIDRVDSSGVATPSKEETIIGINSTGSITSCVRGVEGTAQAHTAGAVAEILLTAKGWNDIIDAFLVAFNQDGTIRDSTVLTTPEINNLASTFQYVITPSAITADRIATLPLLTAGDTFTFNAMMGTLTNKRITKRVTTITSNANPTINTDNCDVVDITAQAAAIASMTTNLSGTPTNFQTLVIRLKDDGTARAITWGTSYEARGVALPTTTVLSKVLTIGFIYDTTTSKWGCVASAQEA